MSLNNGLTKGKALSLEVTFLIVDVRKQEIEDEEEFIPNRIDYLLLCINSIPTRMFNGERD